MTDSIPLTLLFALLFGAACGLVNGLLVGVVQMPAFIVTLATMLIYRSVAQYACQHLPGELIGNGSSVYRMSNELGSYDALYTFGNARVAGVPIVGIVMVLMVAAFVYVCTSTKFGKKIYAVGSNAKAAHLAGISVPLMKTSSSPSPARSRALAAFLWVAMNASADPATTGNSYEMYAIASVVLGGISMSGGRGRMIGVLFGALSYDVIDKIIIALKMDSLIQDTIKGVILIVVIMIQVAGPQLKEFFSSAASADALTVCSGQTVNLSPPAPSLAPSREGGVSASGVGGQRFDALGSGNVALPHLSRPPQTTQPRRTCASRAFAPARACPPHPRGIITRHLKRRRTEW